MRRDGDVGGSRDGLNLNGTSSSFLLGGPIMVLILCEYPSESAVVDDVYGQCEDPLP